MLDNGMMAEQVNVYEAKSRFSALLSKVEAGEEVIIARHGRPVARLVAVRSRETGRIPGGWKGRVRIADNFDALDEQSLQDWYEGPVEPR